PCSFLSSPPPSLTLFPYTTLFRSRDRLLVPAAAQRSAGVGGAAILPDDGVVDRLAGRAVPHDRGLALVGDADGGDVLRRKPGLRDRKSTRLNSSHQIISYAVFCLK